MTWKKLTPTEHEEQVCLFDWCSAMEKEGLVSRIPFRSWQGR